MPPWAWLVNYRHYLERLLLSVEELSDPHWEPDTSIEVFLQAREELRLLALRLAGTVRFLSRVRVYRGLVDNAPSLPLLLQDTPGLSLENYRVPGCAANMMSIIMVLLGRLCDAEGRDRQALLICSPILQEFRATAMAAARQDHMDTEYPQFHRNGQLRELFYEIDWFRRNEAIFSSWCIPLIARGVRSPFCPLNRMPPSAPKTGVRIRDKFLNCDFPTVGQMVDFAHHPFMARVSREILEPLYQFFLRIREDFTWSPETKTKGKSGVRDYLEMAGRLSDYVIRHHDLAEAKRIPMPRVAWLQVVMRADSVYGFEGDGNQLLRHAVDRIVEKDDEGTRPSVRPPSRAKIVLWFAGRDRGREVEAMETRPRRDLQLASTKFAHVEYVREHLCPLCELICGCIPSAVTVPGDLPEGRAEFLCPYVAHIWKRRAAWSMPNRTSRRHSLILGDLVLDHGADLPLHDWATKAERRLDCENALLQDEIEASKGAVVWKRPLNRRKRYGQSPSGRFFV
ncbi:hypothetical protein B0H13DRAFT_1914213 [Mycena leptocephala]|nr:hypothetical protein B0H13DRAFT_1914213 [Mycena leptocephala]